MDCVLSPHQDCHNTSISCGFHNTLHSFWVKRTTLYNFLQPSSIFQDTLSLSLFFRYLYNCSHRKKAILQANNDPYNSACVSAIEKETTLTMLLDSGGQIERLIITNGGNYSNMRHHKFIYIFAIHIIYRSNQNNLHNNKIMSYAIYTSILGRWGNVTQHKHTENKIRSKHFDKSKHQSKSRESEVHDFKIASPSLLN